MATYHPSYSVTGVIDAAGHRSSDFESRISQIEKTHEIALDQGQVWEPVCLFSKYAKYVIQRYFIAEQPAPAPRLARIEGRATLTHLCYQSC